MTRQNVAIWVVLVTALMWGMWWFPVGLLEAAGLRGPWIAMAMAGLILPSALIWIAIAPRRAAGPALLGGALIGVAVALYAMAASYTDFIRAVLLFYLAPTWSTVIELVFLGRRWRIQSLGAIILSLSGVILITRGEVSLDGLGAVGDWMALGSGLAWSAGMAMIFATGRSAPSLPFLFTALGGLACAALIAVLDGSQTGNRSDITAAVAASPMTFVFIAVYIGPLLAGAVWGGIVLPPTIVTYLLSVEVLAGVVSSALILDERFGPFEIGGTLCILGAVLIEVAWTRHIAKPDDRTA